MSSKDLTVKSHVKVIMSHKLAAAQLNTPSKTQDSNHFHI